MAALEDRRFRTLAIALFSWLTLVFILGIWWGRLLLIQAARIAELESKLGLASEVTQNQWHRTERMLFWESGSFVALIFASTGVLFWLYWRDAKRTKSIQAFFAAVTHELRTPLSSIRLQAESISGASEKDQTLVQRLLEDTLRLEAQVERTLELARLEGGGPVFCQPLELKLWLKHFLSQWTLHHPKVQITEQLEDLCVEADPHALQIILRNILENSLKHSKQKALAIQISGEKKGDLIFLKVGDNGVGFRGNVKLLGRIFQSSQGTGVGLYLIKSLMFKMKGWIEFTFRSGFEITLCFREGTLHG